MFQYVSDIHLEYLSYIPYIKKSADNLFLVGDIGHPGTFLFNKFLTKCSETYKNVFLIYGNHEYYSILRGKHKKLETMKQKLEYVKDFPKNVYFLNNSCVYFHKKNQTVHHELTHNDNKQDYIKIIGSTLWSDRGQYANNFKNIFMEENKFLTFEHQSYLFNESKYYLIHELYREDIESIILTHYTTHLCTNGIYLDNKDTNHIRELFFNKNLIACINGHTHTSVNLVAPGTNIKLLANCFGYKNESQDIVKYNENAVLDINVKPQISLAGLYSKSEINPIDILYNVMHRSNPVYDIGNLDDTTPFSVSTVNKDNSIIYVNKSFEKLTGYTLNEIRGKNCRFLQSPSGEVKRGSPREHCDNQLLFNIKSKVCKKEECQFITYNFTKVGDKFINLITIIPIQINKVDYLVGLQCDISSEIYKFKLDSMDTSILDNNILQDMISYRLNTDNNQQIEESTDTASVSFSFMSDDELNNSKPRIRYKYFFDDNPSFLCIIDKNYMFKKTNATFLHTLGYSKNEMYNKLFLDFIYKEDIHTTMKCIADLDKNTQVNVINRYVKKDGSIIKINWNLKTKGNIIYCAGMLKEQFMRGDEAILLS